MILVGYMPDTHGGPYEQAEPEAERSANFAAQLLEESEQAERSGFDGLFVPERHARPECMFPAPTTLLAAIAARTQRVKIGTYVLMPPLYNPVQLAEETAMIDLVSRGRLILGLGVGYHPRYFDHVGVPIKQREGRFEECVAVMRQAWTTTGPSAFHGRYYHYDAIHLTPKPYQKPHPPIWIGAFGPKSIARAGRLGEVWGAAPFLDSVDAVKAQLDIYREAAIKAGKTPRVALLRDGWLASSMEESEQTFGRLWVEECKFYFRWGMLAPTSEFRSESDFTLKSVRRHMVLGTAADWLDQLHYWQALFGAEWLILRCRLPLGPSAEQTRECIQRLGEEVLPKLKRMA